ncbi:hypothetical protein BS329_02805 [Amycolatopsis coloradensis]|uniref:Uncharacterized protein n=1 Tax=Amycolatopsis coloradensis TaxID=76021 RepID=A0A1R0L2X9_9PSEU|nr:hypothetical protein BS329_02805 [Amycolatopsis coloradensis]
MSVPETPNRPGDESGAPLELEPPPPVVVVVGGFSVEGFGVVVGGGVVGGVVFVEEGGSFVGEGSGFGPGPGPGPGFGFGAGGGGGGVMTLVVSLPSGPTDVTVVGGGVEPEGAPGIGEPLTVIGPPGTALPGTSWTPAGEVPCPPGKPVPPAVVETPGPASSAIAAKAVATTRPPTPSTA